MHAHNNTHIIYACIHTCIHAHIHTCTYTLTYSPAYTLTCIYTQTCMHVFIHMHMHAHTLSDIHTHIHTASPSTKSKPPPGPQTHVLIFFLCCCKQIMLLNWFFFCVLLFICSGTPTTQNWPNTKQSCLNMVWPALTCTYLLKQVDSSVISKCDHAQHPTSDRDTNNPKVAQNDTKLVNTAWNSSWVNSNRSPVLVLPMSLWWNLEFVMSLWLETLILPTKLN